MAVRCEPNFTLACSGWGIQFIGNAFPNDWTPKVGNVYRVNVSAKPMAPVTYDVEPIDCR